MFGHLFTKIPSISTTELKEMMRDQQKIFIDVRTRSEYKHNGLRQFKNMPLGSDYSTLPKNKEIYVICQSGMRSKAACKQMKKLGLHVTNIRGGMNQY
ncbi:rhodanese-like domain-containing protein [Kurthia senegalensis]|uniref:rhodanese-like domain-containing protein n=1 Tax=Kurthia senegalensis TaxID=1033740 RepID=UPI000288FE32|nr:rhodanese-like domain-containing protein [Kurthia senegalensis]